jgi:hypothetical protein
MHEPDLAAHQPPRRDVRMAHCRRRALYRNPLANPWHLIVTLLLALIASTGCTVQLAPDYDKTIVDGLTSANEQTLTLFASISSGASPASFATREATYNSIIGKFDALRVQAMARPTPQPWFLKGLGSNPSQESNTSDHLKPPTPDIIGNIIKNLTRMRDQDKAGTLTADVVAIYKNSYELSITQALTYEKALQR